MKLTVTWLTIISFFFNLLLTGLGLYQFLDSTRKEDVTRAMIRNWQNQAEGISNGLLQISQNPSYFTSAKDMSLSVGVAAQSARSLNEAMLQQRFYSDEEVKKQKEQSALDLKKMMDQIRNSTTQTTKTNE